MNNSINEILDLKKDNDKLHNLLLEQWQQNYFIKNKNIELEDKIEDLKKQLNSLKNHCV
jgi:uncharacterized coiled-coil DUF342 family protein